MLHENILIGNLHAAFHFSYRTIKLTNIDFHITVLMHY